MNLVNLVMQAKKNCSYNEDTKQTITDSIHTLLSKIKIDNIEMFFFLYGFLLNEVYDDNEPTMGKIFVVKTLQTTLLK